jgi:putative SOS response-associated peptidase YedK
MCGRFTLSQTAQTIAEVFALEEVPPVESSYNIAPTQFIATIKQAEGSVRRQFQRMRWGLIPSWSKDPKIGNRLINARAETIHEKPSFRSGFKNRRCLIPSDGFYEWQKQETGSKQPYYIYLRNHKLFAFAGIWDRWTGADGEEVESCTIVTTQANPFVASLHDRMPVILNPEEYDLWLSPLNNHDSDRLKSLLQPYPAAQMEMHPVSQRVNKTNQNDPELIAFLN